MAYNRDQLRQVSAGFWRYKTQDTHATVDTAGYFNEDGSPLKLGDTIEVLVVTNIDASNEAVSTKGNHTVNSVVRGNPDVIDCTDVTVQTMTDTD